MNNFSKIALISVTTTLLCSCGILHNNAENYVGAQASAPLKVPASMSQYQSAGQNYYDVQGAKTHAKGNTKPDLTPPGFDAKKILASHAPSTNAGVKSELGHPPAKK